MQRMISLAGVLLLCAAGCGGVNEKEISDSYQRFCENFLLHLQKQYNDPQTSPVDLTIKVAPRYQAVLDKPATGNAPRQGRLTFIQIETGPNREADRQIILQFRKGSAGWEMASGTAEVIESRVTARGKVKTSPGNLEKLDALKDQVLAPRIRAAFSATPQY